MRGACGLAANFSRRRGGVAAEPPLLEVLLVMARALTPKRVAARAAMPPALTRRGTPRPWLREEQLLRGVLLRRRLRLLHLVGALLCDAAAAAALPPLPLAEPRPPLLLLAAPRLLAALTPAPRSISCRRVATR